MLSLLNLKVRMSACYSLRTLTVFSLRFACEALNLMMDMLNDDSTVVRLQALDTIHHMATSDHLKVEKIHIHRVMFLLLFFPLKSSIGIECLILRSFK